MNSNSLKGFRMLADTMSSEQKELTYHDSKGTHKIKVNYSPLTGTVSIARIACPQSEIAFWLKKFYNAEFISLK